MGINITQHNDAVALLQSIDTALGILSGTGSVVETPTVTRVNVATPAGVIAAGAKSVTIIVDALVTGVDILGVSVVSAGETFEFQASLGATLSAIPYVTGLNDSIRIIEIR